MQSVKVVRAKIDRRCRAGRAALRARLNQADMGPLSVLVPDPASLSPKAALLAIFAALLFVPHRGILTTSTACSALALAAFAVSW